MGVRRGAAFMDVRSGSWRRALRPPQTHGRYASSHDLLPNWLLVKINANIKRSAPPYDNRHGGRFVFGIFGIARRLFGFGLVIFVARPSLTDIKRDENANFKQAVSVSPAAFCETSGGVSSIPNEC